MEQHCLIDLRRRRCWSLFLSAWELSWLQCFLVATSPASMSMLSTCLPPTVGCRKSSCVMSPVRHRLWSRQFRIGQLAPGLKWLTDIHWSTCKTRFNISKVNKRRTSSQKHIQLIQHQQLENQIQKPWLCHGQLVPPFNMTFFALQRNPLVCQDSYPVGFTIAMDRDTQRSRRCLSVPSPYQLVALGRKIGVRCRVISGTHYNWQNAIWACRWYNGCLQSGTWRRLYMRCKTQGTKAGKMQGWQSACVL